MDGHLSGIMNVVETDTLPMLEENLPYEARALQYVRDAFSAFERVKRYQTQLTELIKGDLYEQSDGVVRRVETEAERVEMQCKLLATGHQILEARDFLEEAKRNPFYSNNQS